MYISRIFVVYIVVNFDVYLLYIVSCIFIVYCIMYISRIFVV